MTTEHLTPTDRLYNLGMELATRRPSSDPSTSVEIKDDNAKGAVHIVVKVSHSDPDTAKDQADAIYNALRGKYPRENGTQS